MGKIEKPMPFAFELDAFSAAPLSLVGPWLNAQAGLLGALRTATEHWYERRAADLAAWQTAVDTLAACSSTDGLAEAQMRCGSALADRLVADLSGWRDDLVSIGASAASVLGAAATDTSQSTSAKRT